VKSNSLWEGDDEGVSFSELSYLINMRLTVLISIALIYMFIMLESEINWASDGEELLS
jgi:hypothetical protein